MHLRCINHRFSQVVSKYFGLGITDVLFGYLFYLDSLQFADPDMSAWLAGLPFCLVKLVWDVIFRLFGYSGSSFIQ